MKFPAYLVSFPHNHSKLVKGKKKKKKSPRLLRLLVTRNTVRDVCGMSARSGARPRRTQHMKLHSGSQLFIRKLVKWLFPIMLIISE